MRSSSEKAPKSVEDSHGWFTSEASHSPPNDSIEREEAANMIRQKSAIHERSEGAYHSRIPCKKVFAMEHSTTFSPPGSTDTLDSRIITFEVDEDVWVLRPVGLEEGTRGNGGHFRGLFTPRIDREDDFEGDEAAVLLYPRPGVVRERRLYIIQSIRRRSRTSKDEGLISGAAVPSPSAPSFQRGARSAHLLPPEVQQASAPLKSSTTPIQSQIQSPLNCGGQWMHNWHPLKDAQRRGEQSQRRIVGLGGILTWGELKGVGSCHIEVRLRVIVLRGVDASDGIRLPQTNPIFSMPVNRKDGPAWLHHLHQKSDSQVLDRSDFDTKEASGDVRGTRKRLVEDWSGALRSFSSLWQYWLETKASKDSNMLPRCLSDFDRLGEVRIRCLVLRYIFEFQSRWLLELELELKSKRNKAEKSLSRDCTLSSTLIGDPTNSIHTENFKSTSAGSWDMRRFFGKKAHFCPFDAATCRSHRRDDAAGLVHPHQNRASPRSTSTCSIQRET
ncbi:hypothetical protein M409DRAFT_56887 [Zasmidium cellare ATCC 36951]|uniref:Uncharacterized protein n=1 Tax=Zasmidium cellare ATCC 36951 TaxID=1080233 RepID=A0A6A6CAX9_ZASCE|nr:uncharacterized protein M409DRAFT_56887 [Zasmidium cellare ATCC 36951]KAF2164191.1 hypothetical protein M409DRAFT_56887 [Zasmidium cellare ATCC 36951]